MDRNNRSVQRMRGVMTRKKRVVHPVPNVWLGVRVGVGVAMRWRAGDGE